MFAQRYPATRAVGAAAKSTIDLVFPGALWTWEHLVAFIFQSILAAYVVYAVAAWHLAHGEHEGDRGHRTLGGGSRPGIRWILVPLVFFQITMIFVPGTMTTDIYNYAIYGEMPVLYGASPFVHTPHEFPQSPLYYLIPLYWHDAPSVYGPLWIDISTGVAALFQTLPLADELLAYRAVANVAHTANALLVWSIARRVAPGRETSAILAYAWNPLLLVEFCLNGHNDVLMLTFVLVGILLTVSGRPLAGAVGLGLSVATKYTSVLIAPLLLVWSASRAKDGESAEFHRDRHPVIRASAVLDGRRLLHLPRLALRAAAIALVVALLYLPWFQGAETFGPVLYWMTGPRINNFWPDGLLTSVTTSLTNASGMSWNDVYDPLFRAFKIVAKVALVVWIAGEALRLRSMGDVLAGSARVLLVFLLVVNTWMMPWYYTWPLAVAAALGWQSRLVRVCAGFTLTAAIAMYQHQFSHQVVDERLGLFLVLPVVMALAPDVLRRARSAWRAHGYAEAARVAR